MTIFHAIPTLFAQQLTKLKPHTILVTGATSGLGRCAIDYLHQAGVPCIATGRHQTVLDELSNLGIETVALDLAKASDDSLERLLTGVDIVWHCAALSSPWGAYDEFYQANVIATQRLAQTASNLGIKKFVHISTPSLYFDFSHRYNVHETDMRLTADSRFINHYIHTKFLAEQFLLHFKAASHTATDFVILRPRAIFGRYDKVLLPKILAIYHTKNGKVPLPNGGAVLMDVSFADNVVYAMSLASLDTHPTYSHSKGSPMPIFNITNQSPIRLNALLSQLFHQLGKPLTIKSVPYPIIITLAQALEKISHYTHKEPMLTAYSAGVLYYDMTLNTDHAKDKLGYTAVFDLDTAIKITAESLAKEFF